MSEENKTKAQSTNQDAAKAASDFISAKDLLQEKELINRRLGEKFKVETDLGTLLFRMPTREDIIDSSQYADARHSNDLSDDYLIYMTCEQPDFKDRELQKEFLGKDDEPIDIIGKIFRIGEIREIATIIMQKVGFGKESVKAVDEVKN